MSTTLEKLNPVDTFKDWQRKINLMVDGVDESIAGVESLKDEVLDFIAKGEFAYDPDESSGLNAFIVGGKVRDGSTIDFIADTTLSLAANTTSVVCIFKRTGVQATVVVYTVDNLPEEFVIPIGRFVCDASTVVEYEDLRTQFNTASGSAGSASGLLQFDKLIERDVDVPSTRNALSVGPVVAPGVTVSIGEDSTWVVL